MGGAKPAKRLVWVEEAKKNCAEVPHKGPGELAETDRKGLANVSHEAADVEIGPGPGCAQAVAGHEDAVCGDASDGDALGKSDPEKRMSAATTKKYEAGETDLANDGGAGDPHHAVVSLEEPLQQKWRSKEAHAVDAEEFLLLIALVDEQDEQDQPCHGAQRESEAQACYLVQKARTTIGVAGDLARTVPTEPQVSR